MTVTLNSTGILYNDSTRIENYVTATRAIFSYGASSVYNNVTNLVNNSGIVSTDVTGVGTTRHLLAGAGYGGDKAIFGYGKYATTYHSVTNRVSQLGVIATDTTGVGTARYALAAAGYGGDKSIFGFGAPTISSITAVTNLVSNTGVVATDTAGVGTARKSLAAASYGGDKAIFGYGDTSTTLTYIPNNVSNLVSNTGVVAGDTTGVGTARWALAAAGYGGDKAIFGYGNSSTTSYGTIIATTNLVSNTGVVAGDTTGVGTARMDLSASGYGGDKALFYLGLTSSSAYYNISNLVSNTGIVASDTTGVGTARAQAGAASYSS